MLAHVLSLLNTRHDYGLDLLLLSVDEGISGYRDDSLDTVKRNELQYNIPLTIVSYKQLYGWTMDEIVKEIGTKNNCTFCGVFRRQALDRGAYLLKATKVATGNHELDNGSPSTRPAAVATAHPRCLELQTRVSRRVSCHSGLQSHATNNMLIQQPIERAALAGSTMACLLHP